MCLCVRRKSDIEMCHCTRENQIINYKIVTHFLNFINLLKKIKIFFSLSKHFNLIVVILQNFAKCGYIFFSTNYGP